MNEHNCICGYTLCKTDDTGQLISRSFEWIKQDANTKVSIQCPKCGHFVETSILPELARTEIERTPSK